MPSTNLYFAPGDTLSKHIQGGTCSPVLTSDFEELLQQPLVIRTDVRGETAFLLPRTDTVKTVSKAISFILRVLKQAEIEQKSISDICFIAHRFIPAAASAFSYAMPGNRRVRIDAIWGLPDGLEFCTHDSYEVDAKTQRLLDKRVRYKSTFLANLTSGEWKIEALAQQYSWKEALSKKDVLAIAEGSRRLAEERQAPVVTMWFARIPPESGHPALLPWRLTTEGAPREVIASAGSHFFGSHFKVRNEDDLSRLDVTSTNVSAVLFKPDEPHLRDEIFLQRLAQTAAALRIPINLEGSFLAHAYYVLRKAGAHVACIDPIDPKPVATRFRKLVRDRIPVKIERSGEIATTATLLRPELLEVLKTKLVEESLEVLNVSGNPLREEMADVYEVLRAMCDALGCKLSDVKKDADSKRQALGGFRDGVVLVETNEMPLISVDGAGDLFDSPSAGRTVDTRSVIGVAGRRAKSQVDRLILPLIPPVPDRHRGPIRVEIRQLNAKFKVVYNEKSVEVIVEGTARPRLRGQLELFTKADKL